MNILPHYNPELDRTVVTDAQSEATRTVLEMLENPYVQELAANGNITVGIIRPHVGPDANLQGYEDTTAAGIIEEQIEGLGVAAKFSFFFDESTIDAFYEGPSKHSMMQTPPSHNSAFSSKWEEFKHLMTSGPSTALLLYSEDNAISKWRDHLGHWNIENARDPHTIRGRMGVDNFNNLVHGSDTPEAVLREMGLIAEAITHYDQTGDRGVMTPEGVERPSPALLGEDTLALLGIETPEQVQVIHDWHVGGAETYIADFLLRKDGQTRHLLAKACTKFFPLETMNEWIQRRELISAHGIVVPDLVAVDGAVLVEEYIPLSWDEAYHNANEQEKISLQEGIDFTQAILRRLGFFATLSSRDFRSHGSDVVMFDFGEDLGSPST